MGAGSRFLINKYAIRLFFALVACSIGGCGEDTHEQIARIGGYEISIHTAPNPLALGEKAEITVKLTDTDRQPATGCRMRLRQYMPGMKMSLDNVYFPLSDVRNEGIYHGESAPCHRYRRSLRDYIARARRHDADHSSGGESKGFSWVMSTAPLHARL
jgi:hypothetical protein